MKEFCFPENSMETQISLTPFYKSLFFPLLFQLTSLEKNPARSTSFFPLNF